MFGMNALVNIIMSYCIPAVFDQPPTAAAIHFQRGLIYFSTSRDQIHRVQLSEGVTNSTAAAAYRPNASSGSTVVYSITAGGGAAISGSGLGGGLAVDWLNNRLYFTEDNKVSVWNTIRV